MSWAKVKEAMNAKAETRSSFVIEVCAEIGLERGDLIDCPDWLNRAIRAEADYRMEKWERHQAEIEARIASGTTIAKGE